ncbi:GNAT family N-acetyltransferase [Alteromonas pelagimontana]|uniref:GNAT family N-acetyltransferase n=1 Tax=Alteromonas pelagimontana TaxID=1858656 RepID=A0A6M4MAE0_9ALTE|nr:GNAT family N-acetyltransferase [Alteromonas pelagimontana]QJR79788.1 GNAT family N-acetyltransferase [Alteromonas pelagimontana]
MDFANTPRLSFDYITHNDADFLYSLDQDEAVMRYINGGRKTSRADIDNVFLPRLNAYANRLLGWGLWKVSLLESPRPAIGWVLVRPMGFFTQNPDNSTLELGWRFMRTHWGQGYATEAATAIRNELRRTGVNRFAAIALPDNVASIAIMKKLGMTFSHTLAYKDEVFDDNVVVYHQKFA